MCTDLRNPVVARVKDDERLAAGGPGALRARRPTSQREAAQLTAEKGAALERVLLEVPPTLLAPRHEKSLFTPNYAARYGLPPVKLLFSLTVNRRRESGRFSSLRMLGDPLMSRPAEECVGEHFRCRVEWRMAHPSTRRGRASWSPRLPVRRSTVPLRNIVRVSYSNLKPSARSRQPSPRPHGRAPAHHTSRAARTGPVRNRVADSAPCGSGHRPARKEPTTGLEAAAAEAATVPDRAGGTGPAKRVGGRRRWPGRSRRSPGCRG